MRKTILLLSFLFISIFAFAESARPTFGVKIERNVDQAYINGVHYTDLIVEFDAAEITSLFNEGVKVTVKSAENPKKKIYKKRFSKSYLYGFSSGQIQVGNGEIITQVMLSKFEQGDWRMIINEKGIY